MFQPGSVKSGGTWQVAQRRLAGEETPPAAAAALASKLPAGGPGAGIASW